MLPVALAHGDVLGISATGWTYTAILTLTSGIAAQGCSSTRRRRSRSGRSDLAAAQPALAVVWSYLLLGEVINGRQAAGIAIVIGGLMAFVVVHQRGGRPGRAR